MIRGRNFTIMRIGRLSVRFCENCSSEIKSPVLEKCSRCAIKIKSLITESKSPAVTEFCIIFEKKSFFCAVMNVKIILIAATVTKSKIIFSMKLTPDSQSSLANLYFSKKQHKIYAGHIKKWNESNSKICRKFGKIAQIAKDADSTANHCSKTAAPVQ